MWEKIKKILQKEGGKCIIIENGQPSYLVMKLEDYSEDEEVNRRIDQWKAAEETEAETENKEDKREGPEVKVEDLPF